LRSWSRLAFCAVAGALVGCPLGCPKGDPQSLYVGPVEEIHLERTGPCTFRATPPLRRSFGQPVKHGVYHVFLNEEALYLDPVQYEPATATFTVKEPYCSQGVQSLRINYYPWVRTANE
jgi:hypothetical protein